MCPIEEKVNETYNGGAILLGNLPVREHRRRTPRLLLAMRSLFVVAAVIVVFNRIRSMERFVEMKPHQESFSSEPDYNTMGFWDTIPISWYKQNDIIWKNCHGNKECARFAVPLDYLDENEDGPWAKIALIRIPAKVSREDPTYRGPILINPGGPGGSGVVSVAGSGDKVQQVLGVEYDVIGFDPRGVGFTTPSVSVFEDSAEETAWLLRDAALPLWNSSSDALARIDAHASVLSTLVSHRAHNAAAYASTPSVARDMLEIIRAHGTDKLQYWGFSYGTILGATYAAMFPNNVGRVLIDGVMDTRNYYATLWNKNLVDTDAGLNLFFEGCVEAGPELCGIYESTAEKVQTRYKNILNGLKRRPLAVLTKDANSTASDYGVIDYATVKALVFRYLYSPYPSGSNNPASNLSFRLSEVEKGDGFPLWKSLKPIRPQFQCDSKPQVALLDPSYTPTYAIACGDGEPVNDSTDELDEFYHGFNSSFTDMWPTRARCASWKVRPKYRFTGPYGGNTSFPLLILGNTADPVTPLSSARSVSEDFKDSSVLLTQNSAGHCSTVATSACTAKAIRSYFRDGVLPKPGTVCEIETKIFGNRTSSLVDALPGEEQVLVENWRQLSESFSVPHFGLMGAGSRGV